MKAFSLLSIYLSLLTKRNQTKYNLKQCSPHGSEPHRFQSAVWCSMAGEASFTSVLLEHLVPVSFRIVPDSAYLARCLADIQSVSTATSDALPAQSEGKRKVDNAFAEADQPNVKRRLNFDEQQDVEPENDDCLIVDNDLSSTYGLFLFEFSLFTFFVYSLYILLHFAISCSRFSIGFFLWPFSIIVNEKQA